VVYRGWMLNAREYDALVHGIVACGAVAFTDARTYLLAHHLPNWYPLLADLTPETRVFRVDADLVTELEALGWGEYFLKDYVKSLKTGRGAIVRDPADAPDVLADMIEYRGAIEGGVCVRRIEDFLPDSEKRYFVVRKTGYTATEGESVPDIVRLCAERIPSDFFSVDVASRSDGALRVVEIGDGQVSDIVGWSPAEFASMWARAGGQLLRT